MSAPRVPPRRRQALHRQPDGGQGVGQVALRAAGPGDLLHRVQLHAAPGLRLPPPLRRPRVPPPDRRERPVGQHHHGRRAGPQGAPATRCGAHHAPRAQGRRHQVRQDRDRARSGSTRTGPAPTSCTSSSSTREDDDGRQLPPLLHLPRPRRRSRRSTPRPARTPSAARPSGRSPVRSSRSCTARRRSRGRGGVGGPLRRGDRRPQRGDAAGCHRGCPDHRRAAGRAPRGRHPRGHLRAHRAGQVEGRGEAHIDQGGAYVNNVRQTDAVRILGPGDLLHDRYVVLRKGRRDVHIVRAV